MAQPSLPGGSGKGPVIFPPGTNLCEHEPWKLVFYDEFNSSSLDTGKWTTWEPGWADDRLTRDSAKGSRIYRNDQLWKDDNVQLRDSILVLISREEPWNWRGFQTQFTSGAVYGYGHNFRRGRFEMRARLPTGFGVWPAFWTWDAYGGRNEIDFLEYWWGYNLASRRVHQKVSSGVNRWNSPAPDAINDWHENYYIEDIADWHVYAAEWDTSFIRYYVDGSLKLTQYRYHTADTSPLACRPRPGSAYYELDAFPESITKSNAGGILILNNAVNIKGEPYAFRSFFNKGSRAFYKELQVDYVRVYQREIQEGLSDLCGTIRGPQTLGAAGKTATYSLQRTEPLKVTWAVSPHFTILSGTDTSVTVRTGAAGKAWIRAVKKEQPAGCLDKLVELPVLVR